MGQNTNDNLNRRKNKGEIPIANTTSPECVDHKEKITEYNGLNLDGERALYGIQNATISNCIFDGPRDGESALKESQDIYVSDCDFRLRYPFWHVKNAQMENSRMTETCRAALWYCKHMTIKNCHMGGIKAVRECEDVNIEDCTIQSSEFGWFSNKIMVKNTELESEYPFLQSSDILLDNFVLNGKYSFQYVENVEIRNSRLDTKDAFWHSKNVTVSDSIVKGEYLGWYSENLKLVGCKIIGTQPLCYAKGLILEDCEMIDCDLAFEYSDVHATITGPITSVKNPCSGHISADSIGEVILDENQSSDASCVIEVRMDGHTSSEEQPLTFADGCGRMQCEGDHISEICQCDK
ncbi:DUF3737 family protein [Methanogenium organophilum]|uniref:DUF3737 family protein n=1 Tax=Methanogenium organophilum TaxID=2199 RepID=A0A9X9S435_METOG|nr:DUF3737 family protein [Methanogenium organophilum]WAI01564.1 DUF3737 family protein [Methanogenium organophilum]